MTESRPEPLRTLLELIAGQVAEIEEQLKALYDDAFIETGGTSVRFGDSASGARLPTGVEDVIAHYRSGSGDSGNQPEDLAVTLLEQLARAADVLAEMQDRIADEAYLDTARARRSRRARLMDLALGAMVGIAVWQVVCSISCGRRTIG
jgi:hypothetical protein